MNLEIKHNGVIVTDKVDLSVGKLYDRLGGTLDNISLSFPYSGINIEINKYDQIEVKADDYSTGVMYVDDCDLAEDNALFTLNALPFMAKNKIRRSRIWNHVTLYQLISDTANNCNLRIKLYGITNYTYTVVSQVHETDLQFLSRICRREGYSVKINNGCLVIFNDYILENNYTALDLSADMTATSKFKRSINGLKSFTVSHYGIESGRLISYMATDDTIDGGHDSIIEMLDTIDEAERFAKGYLRSRNNSYVTGRISMDFNTNVSAGTLVNLSGFDEYDGKYIVSEIMHDIVSDETYLTVRNTLPY